jgi:molecular chaperone DnaJ
VRAVSQTLFGTVQQVTTCNLCRGAGEVIADPCRTCGGEGRVDGSSTVNLRIPAGVSSGNYMTVESMGNAARRNGEPGDLIAVFEEKEHESFTRHGDDILYRVPVSFPLAALGGEIDVPTLNGSARVKIPSGTQSGKVLKLRNKGIPHLHRHGKGDQLVQVTVWVPTKLSGDEKELIAKLGSSDGLKPPEASRSFFERLRETLGV